MKFSHSIAAIVAPVMVLSAPVGRYSPGSNDADAIGPVFPVGDVLRGPEGLLPVVVPGPVVWEENVPGATEPDMTPIEVVNMPGPVMPTDDLPEVTESQGRSWEEEKRSKNVGTGPPASLSEAPLTVPVSDSTWGKFIDHVRESVGKVNPSDVTEDDLKFIWEKAKKEHAEWLAEWYREVGKGQGNTADTN